MRNTKSSLPGLNLYLVVDPLLVVQVGDAKLSGVGSLEYGGFFYSGTPQSLGNIAQDATNQGGQILHDTCLSI